MFLNDLILEVILEDREIAQRLRSYIVLPEDLSSVPSTHIG